MKHPSILAILAGVVMLCLLAVPGIPAFGADKAAPANNDPASQPAGRNTAQNPSDDAEYSNIVKQAAAEAELYITEQPIPDGVSQKLKAFSYDAKSVRYLTAAVGTQRKPIAHLYVANQLIMPLMRADKDVIKTAYQSINALHSKYEKYQEIPKLPPERLSALKMPDPNQPFTIKQMAAVQRAREQKRAQELPLYQYNEQLYILEKSMVVLQLRLDSVQDDDQVVQLLTQAEAAKHMMYSDICAIITAEYKTFTPERAKRFYDKLKPLAEQLRLKREKYSNPGSLQIHVSDNSVFEIRDEFTGVTLANVVNKLAAIAGTSTISVPTYEEVRKGAKK